MVTAQQSGALCPLPTRVRVRGECLHCGTALDAGTEGDFCCAGCESVYLLLREEGLGRYYELRTGRGSPVASNAHRDLKWLEPIEARLAHAHAPERVDLDLQGLQCAACVWLIEELFARREGGLRALVNPALGKVELLVAPGFALRAFVEEVERFGYRLGPALKSEAPRSHALVGRMGLAIAIAMNSMLFALPIYLGLREGPVYQLFRWLTFALSVASFAVGGSVFVRSAWRGLRRGILHLDVPIATGVLLAYGGSAWAFFSGRDGGTYFDTVNVFVALMLVGRWLQERVLERNRNMLLQSEGADALLTRRVRGGKVEVVPCRELGAGDEVLVAPGDLVPVDAEVLGDRASCSLDWINGESSPREFVRGDVVPAGAFNTGLRAVTMRACTDFASSPLPGLLRGTRALDEARATGWWQRIARVYVVGALAAAATGFVFWIWRTGDLRRALEVTTAVLVVTCPCAFGLAAPTAYELVQAGLRRAGLFVRTPGFLDRALAVRRVVFDKTGTLTTGTLALRDRAALDALSDADLEALYNISARSTHPKSVAVRAAIEAHPRGRRVRFIPGLDVEEEPGRGLVLRLGAALPFEHPESLALAPDASAEHGRMYRLGTPAWAAPDDARAEGADLVFAVDGVMLARLDTAEVLRQDAAREIAQLRADGYDVSILSGDAPEKVSRMAHALGLLPECAVGGMTPQGKADWLAAHDRGDTLFIGDGINDGLAAERAFCSGTPAVDRPFMPARTDFYFVSAGLRPVGLALRAARTLARVNRRNLAAAAVYNVATVALSYAGLMSPVLCALVMPASSLSILLVTVASLSPRSSLWKS